MLFSFTVSFGRFFLSEKILVFWNTFTWASAARNIEIKLSVHLPFSSSIMRRENHAKNEKGKYFNNLIQYNTLCHRCLFYVCFIFFHFNRKTRYIVCFFFFFERYPSSDYCQSTLLMYFPSPLLVSSAVLQFLSFLIHVDWKLQLHSFFLQ